MARTIQTSESLVELMKQGHSMFADQFTELLQYLENYELTAGFAVS